MSSDTLGVESIELVREWLAAALSSEEPGNRTPGGALKDLIADPAAAAFAMRFVDRVMRPDDDRTAAQQLHSLVESSPLPDFVSGLNRWGLRLGAAMAPLLPGIVMPIARRRLRWLVGHLVIDARPRRLRRHLRRLRKAGYALNLNLLGEAVLGEAEADRRLQATCGLIGKGEVDYVSVKLSAVASQLNYWDWEGSLCRVKERLRVLLRAASVSSPPVFVNLDMEEYHDLELTLDAFKSVLSEADFRDMTAGIVLQAYLPDSFGALRGLVLWARQRQRNGGGEIKVRLVKGANLAMEQVDATLHGWKQAPYSTKAEVDANYKRLVDWVLTPDRTQAVRVGIGSHNLFDVAWAHLLSRDRDVAHRVEFEMLQGMSPAQEQVVKETVGGSLLLYTPIVAPESFDVAISYLYRRLEENTAAGNFLRVLFDLSGDSEEFNRQARAFEVSVAARNRVSDQARRRQSRPAERAFAARCDDGSFVNEPDTDPALPANRAWAKAVIGRRFSGPGARLTTSGSDIDQAVARARRSGWEVMPAGRRRLLLHRTADQLARRRGDLVNAMVHEGGKTFAQADPEVSEAIDFARYYGDRAVELGPEDGARFSPLGVVAVIPPWNFPVAIPAGGMLAALAAGNSVLLKPSELTPRCAEIIAECAWAAGVPGEALQFFRMREGEVSKRLIMSTDGVILTGSGETARLFQTWKPDLKLFAETSGKNAMIITPNADLDQAVRDLVASAFGHSGQKCSATSLAICVGRVNRSKRFRSQLVDTVRSLVVGPPTELGTTMGPVKSPVEGKLLRGLTDLGPGEEWLVKPERRDEASMLWTPGVRLGVKPGSWFFHNECFGPVLGVVETPTLQSAIEIQNCGAFGLTGGIHTLDPDEVETWLEQVEVGNGYVNRVTTGAVVQRQPFGGWKASNVGPGAKAGGPNYVRQLGTWHPRASSHFLAEAVASDEHWWKREYGRSHDPTNLFCEANLLRYRPLRGIVIRAGRGATEMELTRVQAAADRCGVPYRVSVLREEDDQAFSSQVKDLGVERIRVLGHVTTELRQAANQAGVYLADGPVTPSGRVELLNYLREQAVSRTLHRFGNLVGAESGEDLVIRRGVEDLRLGLQSSSQDPCRL
ncbi:MAG: bifunctional proline dehydrogenase/L-glutamate gamma-semialdehyde dehydrogenase [Actinomycetia bacterium]|nr:bifunctional proline dehydrogenase/L-glutamate gamma-semialdehyde dehydrogenase [Actinomycetes bacterium]